MDAMTYEMLIRRAFTSGRDGRIGADAEFYNRLDHYARDPERYLFALGEVKVNVRSAIEHVIKRARHRLSRAEISSLESMSLTLRKPGFTDRHELDRIINDAEEIFTRLGFETGY